MINKNNIYFSISQSEGGGSVSSVNGKTGNVEITKSDIGLSNVDNTTDLDKPISTAVQNALNGKAGTNHTHTESEITGLTSSLDEKVDTLDYTLDGITSRLSGPSSWAQSNISDAYVYSVYYANGMWVSGTEDGLYYSQDGQNWTKSNISSCAYHALYYDNGVWVTSVSNSGLYYSQDGQTWTQSNITQGNFHDVCYGSGIFVAGSSPNGLYYSQNGQTWTQSNMTQGSFYDVCYGSGIFVAGGYQNGLYYSQNGQTWTQSNITQDSFSHIYYADGLWVAGGSNTGLYYSENGKTWTQSNITSQIRSIYYGSGMWAAGVYNNGLYYSENGQTWTQSNITSGYYGGLYYSDGTWAAGGDGIHYSTDAQTWTQSNITSGNFLNIYSGDGKWVAGGANDGLCYSTDYYALTSHTHPVPTSGMNAATIPSGTSNITIDVSDYITDPFNYLYQVFIMSTNDGVSIIVTVNSYSKKVTFARVSGEEDTQAITINYVIAKFLI